jgi:hypothetical protein
MVLLNWPAILVASIVPMLIGFIYYNPKVLGTTWMNISGVTEEKMKEGNMARIFALAYFYSLLIAVILPSIVVHQSSIFSLVADSPEAMDPNTEMGAYVADFMDRFGDKYRTFKHGLFHGFILSAMLVLPILGTISIFERKTAGYVFIHLGYWTITLMLMSGIVCAWQ